MVGDRRVSARSGVEPDLMATSRLAVECKAQASQSPNDFAISKAGETPHLAANNERYIQGVTNHWLAYTAPFSLGVEESTCDVASNLQCFSDRPSLSHQSLNLGRGGQVHALRKTFDVYVNELFHADSTPCQCFQTALLAASVTRSFHDRPSDHARSLQPPPLR